MYGRYIWLKLNEVIHNLRRHPCLKLLNYLTSNEAQFLEINDSLALEIASLWSKSNNRNLKLLTRREKGIKRWRHWLQSETIRWCDAGDWLRVFWAVRPDMRRRPVSRRAAWSCTWHWGREPEPLGCLSVDPAAPRRMIWIWADNPDELWRIFAVSIRKKTREMNRNYFNVS